MNQPGKLSSEGSKFQKAIDTVGYQLIKMSKMNEALSSIPLEDKRRLSRRLRNFHLLMDWMRQKSGDPAAGPFVHAKVGSKGILLNRAVLVRKRRVKRQQVYRLSIKGRISKIIHDLSSLRMRVALFLPHTTPKQKELTLEYMSSFNDSFHMVTTQVDLQSSPLKKKFGNKVPVAKDRVGATMSPHSKKTIPAPQKLSTKIMVKKDSIRKMPSPTQKVTIQSPVKKIVKQKLEKAKIEIEGPKFKKAKVERPKLEKPKIEKPKLEKPKLEKPKVVKPKIEPMKIERPRINRSKVQQRLLEPKSIRMNPKVTIEKKMKKLKPKVMPTPKAIPESDLKTNPILERPFDEPLENEPNLSDENESDHTDTQTLEEFIDAL
ncbi:hypothetical protein [Ammoniphilus sp. CFH 90114]|uniref:hypothetical protein n=1 Tax=Ammoniphilus sp. CFH 90114 TaxID=2493665 RepID=UPI00100E08D9|nr:hypothetical protein [Ammoniphilus sp. CFH 90114]RXT08144.1 hypothetical protein EIZ39_12140 [Ammoniphilus sp. CFH 90114]